MIELTLPWPHPYLNPNAGKHKRTREPHAKKYKADCYYLTKSKGLSLPDQWVPLSIVFCPPVDRANRNLDNCLSACKAGIDGIALALGADDKVFRPVTLDWGPVVKGGAVRVRIGSEDVQG